MPKHYALHMTNAVPKKDQSVPNKNFGHGLTKCLLF